MSDSRLCRVVGFGKFVKLIGAIDDAWAADYLSDDEVETKKYLGNAPNYHNHNLTLLAIRGVLLLRSCCLRGTISLLKKKKAMKMPHRMARRKKSGVTWGLMKSNHKKGFRNRNPQLKRVHLIQLAFWSAVEDFTGQQARET